MCHLLHFLGMFKLVLQWADEHWKEGVFCLWLGPLYPYVLTFKPEFAEVRNL